MRGNWSPDSMSTMRVVPSKVRIVTTPGCASVTEPMIRAFLPQRMGAHGCQDFIGSGSFDNAHQFSLVGHIEGVKPQ